LIGLYQNIFANETSLGEIIFGKLVELVVRQDVRPERPDDEDAIWEVKCWAKDPQSVDDTAWAKPEDDRVCKGGYGGRVEMYISW
jgi:hypothetical protein